jgi:hypothetical protein
MVGDVFEVGSAASALGVLGVGELFGDECLEWLGDLHHVLFVAFVFLALGQALGRRGAVLGWDS